MRENRREFFRVVFEQFINGEVFMQDESSISVKIDNMSIGGMGFISDVDIPSNEKLECHFTILESSFLIESLIIRKFKKAKYIEYGVKFEIDMETSSHLFMQLNYYQIRQRQGQFRE